MKIEEGKYYRSRSGTVFGPMQDNSDDRYPWADQNGFCWTADGGWMDDGGKRPQDLVEEVPQPPCDGKAAAELGPVRTVTRKEIVPGSYGPEDGLDVETDENKSRTFIGIYNNWYDAEKIREFARLLTEIADAMEEKP